MSALPHPALLSIEDFDKLEWPEDAELGQAAPKGERCTLRTV
jgi:hypothetical protein